MITGRLYEEGTLLRVALAHEQATTWHTKTPIADLRVAGSRLGASGSQSVEQPGCEAARASWDTDPRGFAASEPSCRESASLKSPIYFLLSFLTSADNTRPCSKSPSLSAASM